MRRLLLPSLIILLQVGTPVTSLFAQAPLQPILAEAPANAPDLAPAPSKAPDTAADTVTKPADATAPALAAAPAPETQAPAPAGSPTKLSYSSCNVEGHVLALTFDDGPHAQNTPRLLDILKQRGVKATFFVVGQNAAEYPDILKRIVAEGHELANHSYTHPILASLGEAALRDQLDKTHQAVLRATGVTMKIMRPPYGALSEPQRRWTHANFGYRTILWDVDPLDWKFRDAARVETEILARAKSGSIVLSHDIHKSTVEAMPSTLDALAAKGFKFVTVSELLALDRPSPPKAPATSKPTVKTPAPQDSKPAQKTVAEQAPTKKQVTEAKPSTPAPTASKASPPAQKGDAPKDGTQSKPVALSQEELRKKWLQSMSQR